MQIDYTFIGEFYPELKWKFTTLPIEEQNAFIKKHLPIIINFYERVIIRIEKMMKEHPDFGFICFSGP